MGRLGVTRHPRTAWHLRKAMAKVWDTWALGLPWLWSDGILMLKESSSGSNSWFYSWEYGGTKKYYNQIKLNCSESPDFPADHTAPCHGLRPSTILSRMEITSGDITNYCKWFDKIEWDNIEESVFKSIYIYHGNATALKVWGCNIFLLMGSPFSRSSAGVP